MTSAVIVAAGQGMRMSAATDKLFLEVAGQPVIAHTWQRLDAHPEIDEIILVIREIAREDFNQLAASLSLTKPHQFTLGGEQRQDSVINGLNAISPDCKLVAIHDGARPCVSLQTITETLAAANQTGAAVVGSRVADTLKRADNEQCIQSNVDRTNLWAVQTPQAFRPEIIRRAVAAVAEQGLTVTDDTTACELIGQSVTLIASDTPNPKVTTAADLPLIEALLQ